MAAHHRVCPRNSQWRTSEPLLAWRPAAAHPLLRRRYQSCYRLPLRRRRLRIGRRGKGSREARRPTPEPTMEAAARARTRVVRIDHLRSISSLRSPAVCTIDWHRHTETDHFDAAGKPKEREGQSSAQGRPEPVPLSETLFLTAARRLQRGRARLDPPGARTPVKRLDAF